MLNMPRRRGSHISEIGETPEGPRSTRKRSQSEVDETPEPETPSKRQRGTARTQEESINGDSREIQASITASTDRSTTHQGKPTQDDERPTPRKRGRPPKNAASQNSTPQTDRTKDFVTPIKASSLEFTTPQMARLDKSARKKSAQVLIEHALREGDSEDEDGDNLIREIYGSDEDDEGEEETEDISLSRSGIETVELGEEDPAATPSRTPKKKGRPRKRRSPTPPRDLPPHEMYFVHNKPGRPKTSDNTLSSLGLLSHEEYFSIIRDYKDPHSHDIQYLDSLHAECFPQWLFELSQGFSLCLYGFGSKRPLLHNFATYLSSRKWDKKDHKIVMVNGYTHTMNMRELLSIIGSAIVPNQRIPSTQPTAMLQNVISHLSAASGMRLTIIVNSIDAPPLRRHASQSILSQLATHPQIHLACSADSPDFPLLWDIGIRSAFNFVFHDCTTFAPFAAELDVVDDVHELLGRNTSRVNGREGVAFVLKSLPENAKNLFRLLVGEVLIATEEEDGGGPGEESAGVEYRMVYNKAVEEFICSSEMAFRTLLKEFHDHQMITSRKDTLGTELLSVPFRKEELEVILEDLMA